MPEDPNPKNDKDGDDPRDKPRPIVYGEEIEKAACNHDFVDGIGSQRCDPRPENIGRRYRGELSYLLFPDTQWTEEEAVREIRRAQEFYAEYCIFLNFSPASVSDKARRRLKSAYDEWKTDFENHVFPHGTTLSEAEKGERLNNATIPRGLFDRMNNLMIVTQNDAGAGKSKGLVVFVDQYIAQTGRPSRGSANHAQYFQIGLSYPDSRSPHVLSHELVHLLGKVSRKRGGSVTWSHNSPCTDKAMSIALPRRWTQPFNWSGRYLEGTEYFEIIGNRGGKKILKKIR